MSMIKLRSVVLFCIVLLFVGCASNPPREEKGSHRLLSNSEKLHNPVEQQIPPKNADSDKSGQDDQRLLDSAIEFYQASIESWEQGDLEKALDALDKSYALILKVGQEADQSVLQQKEDLRITIARRIMEVYASRFNVANGNQHAIPRVMNKHVEKALKLFQGREKTFFIESYVRSGKYRPAILKALKEEGLPEELSWLPLIESGFKVRALSRARALGMWQFIASTGYKFGLERTAWIDERMDTEKSTRAAIAYLKELHSIFGDWSTAIAAYNCGEGRVLRVIKRQKIQYLDNFWDLYTSLPYETASYVPKFMAVLHIVSNPEKYGFVLPTADAEIALEDVTINKQVHIKKIAENIGIPYTELKGLNPELRKNVTPPIPYSLKVPEGKSETLLAKLSDIPIWVAPVPPYVVHRVRRGESLSVIASRYRTSVRSIKAMNRLKSSNFIRQGWKLKIPTSKRISYNKKRTPIHSKSFQGNLSEYVVRKGDSLWKIANRYRTTTKAIKSINQLRTTRLAIGQVLQVPKSN
jgi:membrane-bound lytic murein transglycosylase D